MMDIFTQKRFMTWTIIILVILNLSALATILFRELRKPPPPPPSPERRPEEVQHFLERELNLSPEQAQQFEELRKQHHFQSRAVRDEIRRLRKEIMDELFKSSPDTTKVRKLSDEIGMKEAELVRILFYHFMDLESVCQPEQNGKFRALIQELLRMIAPPEPHQPPGDKPPP
jgi:Spy/CpxP family protein refolding chaperone